MDSLNAQLYAFAITLLAGGSTGLLFDLFRLLRHWIRPGAISTIILDLFFWMVITPVIVIYILMANWGQLRLYVFIGIGLGLIFYYLIFSRLIVNAFLALADVLGKTLSFIFHLAMLIFLAPARMIQDLRLGFITRRRGRAKITLGSGLRWKSPVPLWLRRR